MHGVKRVRPEDVPAAVKEATTQKIKQYRALVGIAMQKVTATLLRKNPDFYSLWNYRREMLLALFAERGADAEKELCEGELILTQQALTEGNSKSYCAWHQRRWIVERGHVDLNLELALCKRFLEADERNFHCWNYRRFVAARAEVDPKAEFDFTTALIEANFSNYSAWHHRSTVLPMLPPDARVTLSDELELLQQVVFVEPDDQSAWMYHWWVLNWARRGERTPGTAAFGSASQEEREGLVGKVADTCRSLLEAEPTCKWARLMLATVLADKKADADARREAAELLQSLEELDPMHAEYYRHVAAGL